MTNEKKRDILVIYYRFLIRAIPIYSSQADFRNGNNFRKSQRAIMNLCFVYRCQLCLNADYLSNNIYFAEIIKLVTIM